MLSNDILLKCRTNVDRYSSAGVGGLCVGIFSSLQGWLCVGVLCALQCAKNSVGVVSAKSWMLVYVKDVE